MDEVISVSVPGYKDQVFHSLHQLQQRGVNCDVTLQACDGIANLHSIILEANSESHSNHHGFKKTQKSHQIDCTKYSIQVVEAVVICLYTGEIIIEEKNISDLIEVCEDLDLNQVCETLKQHHKILFKPEESYSQFDNGQNESSRFIDDDEDEDGDDEGDDGGDDDEQSFKMSPMHSDSDDVLGKEIVNEGEHLYLKITNTPITCKSENSSDHENLNSNDISDDENSISTKPYEKELSDNDNLKHTVREDLTSLEDSVIPEFVSVSDNMNKRENNGNTTSFVKIRKRTKKEYVDTIIPEKSTKEDSVKQGKTKESSEVSCKIRCQKNVRRKGTKRSYKSNIKSEEKVSSNKRLKQIKRVKKQKPVNKTTKTERINRKVLKKKEKDTSDDDNDEEKDEDFSVDSDMTSTKKEWKCVQCNLVFPSYAKRGDHLREVHKPYPCELCDWIGIQPHLYASHMYGQHKVVIFPKKYPLVECDVEGCSHKCLNINLYNHKKCHRYKTDKLVCHVCGMEFTSEGGLRAHSSHHKEEEMKFKCKECGKVFGWDHELTKHLNAEHKSYKLCHKCPFKSKVQMTLSIHLHNVHGEAIPSNMKKYQCDLCDFYCFYPSYLKNHKQENHSEDLNFKCSDCPKKFKTNKSLYSHRIASHSNEVFRCDKCSYTTRSRRTLRTHEQCTHSEARPFSCHICEYSCKLKGNLNSHMKNIHKLEIISTHKLREQMIKTGKGYNEYMSARRNFIDSEKSSSDLSVQTRPISEKTITTGKSYNEYAGERMNFMDSERISSNLTLQNRPIGESYNEHIPVHVSEERHVQMGDNLEKYQELLNFVGNCNIPLSYS
ncbi:zinc finger protein 676-like [Mytilus californianus]|uniref:zinc finger protein 676-like n=1 Tax=Mytilus californianus TaxID=6549 RepID=UPI002246AFE2|nr:zinc finger protein 676-like [Mytilus californianus]